MSMEILHKIDKLLFELCRDMEISWGSYGENWSVRREGDSIYITLSVDGKIIQSFEVLIDEWKKIHSVVRELFPDHFQDEE